MQELQKQVADTLLDIGAVGFSVKQPVTFKSGIVSPVYVDNRRLPFHPSAWEIVIDTFRSWIREHNLTFDAIAGIEAAGIPHSAALGFATEQPSLFVRKEPKGHGKGQQVEGGDVNGLTVLLVEDLVTTGGSSLAGVHALRQAGATVTDCLAIVSYEFDEALQAFAASQRQPTHHRALYAHRRASPRPRDLFDAQTLRVLQDWRRDPYGWAGRQ